MSTIAKVFIFINLILAGTFLGSSATLVNASKSWKDQAEEAQRSLDQQKREADEMRSRMEQEAKVLQDQLQQLKDDNGDLQNDAEGLRNQIQKLERENSALETQVTKIEGTLAGIAAELGELRKLNQDLQERSDQARAAERDALAAKETAEAAMHEAQVKLQGAEEQIGQLQGESKNLGSTLDKIKAQLEQAKSGGFVASSTVQPEIHALVRAVNLSMTPAFVILDAGKDKGVERGFTFDIYKGSKYKGRARVESVEPTLCSAILELQVAGAKIEEGDEATTRLP